MIKEKNDAPPSFSPDAPIVAPVFPANAGEGSEAFGAPREIRREAVRHSRWTLAFLSLLMAFASIATDMYLPAMPTIGKEFDAADGTIEWTVSGFLAGFCFGQLIWGPIGDRVGRRRPVAAGIALFIVGSVGCALSGSAGAMIAWRAVQAIGACACVVLARAMVRDLFQGVRAAQMLSILITVMAVAPLLGPLVGGQILAIAGWRAIFWTLALVGTVTLFALKKLPETLAVEKRNRESYRALPARYRHIIGDRAVWAYAGVSGCFYGGLFAHLSGTPFAYIEYYGLPPQYYGTLFGVAVLGIMACNMVNSRIAPKIGGARLARLGAGVIAAAGFALALAGETGIGGLAGLVVPIILFVSMNGFIVANSLAGAMERFPDHAGSTSALVGAIQSLVGVLGSVLTGALADGTPQPMCAVMAFMGVAALAFAFAVPQERTS
ncbi:MAG: multidrug effflux MFS transporter [Rickettsiales bacterium]